MSDASESFRLDGQVAVVTGASAGLGARFARVHAQAGATVYAVARRADRLAELAESDERIRPLVCDIARPEERERLVADIAGRNGGIDVLVNNAGVSGKQHASEESLDITREVLEVNLVAAYDLCQRASASDRPPRAIVNVTSILGMVAGAPLGGAAYAASKGGLIALTRELAAQWGSRGIRVNALAPGWFRTEMTADLFADAGAERYVNRNTMLGRAGEPGELDGALLLLVSPPGSYLTGQVLVVDGGWTAR